MSGCKNNATNKFAAANFDLMVDKVITIINAANMEGITKLIELHMQFGDNSCSKPFHVRFQNIETTDWLKFDERSEYNPDITTPKAKRLLGRSVRQQLHAATCTIVYQAAKSGLYKIDNIPIYCAGQYNIRPTSAKDVPKIILTNKTQRLDIDTRLTETEALENMIGLICLSANVGRVLLSYKLGYFMRQAYIDAGIKPSACVYLYGQTGSNKTTYSCFLTQLYNRNAGIQSPTRLNASIAAAVNILSEICDDVVIFDDLCPADSKQIRSKQEETFIEIERYIGDGTVPAKMIGKTVSREPPKCGVIFTGEYLIGKGSDAARMLPVEMEKPDSEYLKYFQDNPLIVSTFYKYFLEWYVENYDDIVALLKGWLTDYRKVNIGVHQRLQETHFFLNTAYLLLMTYCYDVGYLTEDEAEPLLDDFVCLLNELVKKQNFRVQENAFMHPETIDCLSYIREMYVKGQLPYAANVSQFNKKFHAGVLYNGCLCIRGEWLSKHFSADIKEIARDLHTKGALLCGKTALTKQIASLNGMRFYFIPLEKLK